MLERTADVICGGAYSYRTSQALKVK